MQSDGNKKVKWGLDKAHTEIGFKVKHLMVATVRGWFKDFDAEQVMLPDNLKKKREDELFNKEKELRDLQRKRFGFDGDLFKKRQELVKPIQDRVYNAVQKLATDKQYDFILDKSEGITVIFADPKLDKSEDVLKNLGIK